MNISQLIAYLNALHLGEMEGILAKLAEARRACADLDQSELADKLDEAGQALSCADIRRYRKNVETVIARLGHVR